MVRGVLNITSDELRYIATTLTALTTMIILITLPLLCYGGTDQIINVVINSDGAVEVTIKHGVNEGLNTIYLPIKPIEASIEVYVNGVLVPVIYINNTLIIPSNSSGIAIIRYLANISEVNGKFYFKLNTSEVVNLTVTPGIALLTLPENISGVRVVNGNLTLTFAGPTLVEYIVLKYLRTTTIAPTTVIRPIILTTTQSPTLTPTPTALGKSVISTSPTKTLITHTTTTTTTPYTLITTPTTTKKVIKPSAIPLYTYYVVIAIVLASLLIIFTKRLRRGSRIIEELSGELDELDKAIIRKLEELGGSALQSEVYKFFSPNVPKVTFWRHVKRLERLGFIKVIKEGRVNKLILQKKLR